MPSRTLFPDTNSTNRGTVHGWLSQLRPGQSTVINGRAVTRHRGAHVFLCEGGPGRYEAWNLTVDRLVKAYKPRRRGGA